MPNILDNTSLIVTATQASATEATQQQVLGAVQAITGYASETTAQSIVSNQTNGTQKTQIFDEYGFNAECTPIGQIRTAQTHRIVGSGFPGTTLDTFTWTNTNSGTGAITLSNGIGTLSTGLTANSFCKVITPTSARFISGRTNLYRGNIRIPDSGTTDNIRRWGAFDDNNGFFFQISGSTFSVVTRKSGTDTPVTQYNWNYNPYINVSDNNNHVYEIYWSNQQAWFAVDGFLVYTFEDGTTTLSGSLQLKCSIENVNSNGLASDVILEARGQGIFALGELKSDGKPIYISSAGTYVLKRGAGFLHQLTCNDGATGSSIVIYNNTSATGTIISTINTSKITSPTTLFSPGFTFDTGITVVVTGTVNFTIVID